MKNNLKRIMTFILALLMLRSIPLQAFAEVNHNNLSKDKAEIINESKLDVKVAKPEEGKTAADLIKNPDQPAIYTLRTDYKVQRGEKYEVDYQPYIASVGAAATEDEQKKVNKTIKLPDLTGYEKPDDDYEITYDKVKKAAKDKGKTGNDINGFRYQANEEFRYKSKANAIIIKHVFQDLQDFTKYTNPDGSVGEEGQLITTQNGNTGSTMEVSPLDGKHPDRKGFVPEAPFITMQVPENAEKFILEYRYNRAHYDVNFDTKGGTPMPNRTLYYEQIIPTIDDKSIPTKVGSDFLGWMPSITLETTGGKTYPENEIIKDSAGKPILNLATDLKMPASKITFTAVWKDKPKADYAIQFCTEKLDYDKDNTLPLRDRYDFIGSRRIDNADTGSTPDLTNLVKIEEDIDNDFNFPKNNTARTILRSSFLENFEEGDEENGPWAFISAELETTPETVEVKTDTQGLTFEENNGVKTVTSGDHKFKYDFTYDVINGGTLTMTEMIPVIFDANGGKFTNFITPDTEGIITKEVDYDGTTEKAEDPKRDFQTFKGWSETKGGITPVDASAFTNIKEAKTFYAIWDNNDIVVEEIEVAESFKTDPAGEHYKNYFGPTYESLTKHVKVKNENGEFESISDLDGVTLYILDGKGKGWSSKDSVDRCLYDYVKEKNDGDNPSRIEIVKGIVKFKNGTEREVEIPIKVYKNIYEAKTLTKRPYYVPANYVKVTVDPTTKAQDPQKTYYYVNPKAQVVIPGEDPTGKDNYVFTKWTMPWNSNPLEVKLSVSRYQYKEETTITAQYVSDVIPANDDGNKADGTPDDFVKVTFVPTDNGTLEGNSIFYVNPKKDVTIPVKDPVGKQYFTFKEWKLGADAKGDKYTPSTPKKFEEATTITATYDEAKNIIPYDPSEPITRPKGYVRVTFAADPGLKLTEQKAYYVKANAGIKLGNEDLKKPGVNAETGYKQKSGPDAWDKEDSLVIESTDVEVKAKATPLNDVVPKIKDDGTENEQPAGYITVTFKTTDKAGSIEKVVYINPNKAVALEGQAPEVNPITGYEFADWDRPIKEKIQYKDNDVITAKFNEIGDVVPGDKAQPAGYVKVIFDEGEHGELSGTTSYWVKPEVEVTVEAPSVKANTGYKFTNWDKETTLTAKTTDTEINITAEYEKLDDIIPSTDENGKPNAKPEGYVTVTFDKGEHGTLSGQNVYYVNPNKKVDLTNTANAITKRPDVGFTADGGTWTPTIESKKYTADETYTFTFKALDAVIEAKPGVDKPYGYVRVDVIPTYFAKDPTIRSYWVNPEIKEGVTIPPMAIQPLNDSVKFLGWDQPFTQQFKYHTNIVAKFERVSKPTPGGPGGYYPGGSGFIIGKTTEKIVKVPDNSYFKEVWYMQGFNGDFRPKDGLTRAEAAQILANALVEDGYRYNPNFKLPYRDIGEEWYTKAIKIVTEARVFEGYDDGNFNPQWKITRNEWIATLKRFQELGDATGNHMNLNKGHWATAEIEAAYEAGWLKIYTDGVATYEGDKFIPRQEVAAVSNKAFNRVLDKTYIRKNDRNLVTYRDVSKDMWAYDDILCASNTFLAKRDMYYAQWVDRDNNMFNIYTKGFDIVQAKFQRIPR